MDISVRSQAGVGIIKLRGDLKLGEGVDAFRKELDELLANDTARIVVNLGEVRMIDSSGIGALVRSLASSKQRGGALKLVQPSKLALQTLKIVGLLNLFEIFDSDDAAIQSFG